MSAHEWSSPEPQQGSDSLRPSSNVSAKGPSVMDTLPFRIRTVVVERLWILHSRSAKPEIDNEPTQRDGFAGSASSGVRDRDRNALDCPTGDLLLTRSKLGRRCPRTSHPPPGPPISAHANVRFWPH